VRLWWCWLVSSGSCEHGVGPPGVMKACTWLNRGAPDSQRSVGYWLVFGGAPRQEDTWGVEVQLHTFLTSWLCRGGVTDRLHAPYLSRPRRWSGNGTVFVLSWESKRDSLVDHYVALPQLRISLCVVLGMQGAEITDRPINWLTDWLTDWLHGAESFVTPHFV